MPHNRRPGTADHAGVRDHLRQRQRHGHAAARAGRDGAPGAAARPSVFHAGRGYDPSYNCMVPFEVGITPVSSGSEAPLPTAASHAEAGRPRYPMGKGPPTRHDRGHPRGRRVQAAPAALPAHQPGQPPPARQDPGHHLEHHQGAKPTQMRPDAGDGDTILRYGVMRMTVQARTSHL